MFIHEGPTILRKLKLIAGVAHGESEGSGFLGTEPAKKDGHEQSGELVIGDFIRNASADDLADFRCGKGFAISLAFDERKEIHSGRMEGRRGKTKREGERH